MRTRAGVGRQQIGAVGSVLSYAVVGLPASFFMSQDVGLGLGLSGIWWGASIAAAGVSLFSIAVLMQSDWEKMAATARLRAGVAESESESDWDSGSGSDSRSDSGSEAGPNTARDSGEMEVSCSFEPLPLERSLSCDTPATSPGAASSAPLMQPTGRPQDSP